MFPEIEMYPRTNRPRPPGQWRQIQPQFEVAGIYRRKDDAMAFVRSAAKCDAEGLEYGLRLEREPENPRNAKAIAVIIPSDAPIAAELESLYLVRRSDGQGWYVNVQAYLLLPGLKSGFWEGRKHPFRT